MATDAAREALEANFGIHRDQCPEGYKLVTSGGAAAVGARKQLSLDEMAGIFIVQAREEEEEPAPLVTCSHVMTSCHHQSFAAARRNHSLSLVIQVAITHSAQVIGFALVVALYLWKFAKYRLWSTLPFRAIGVREPRMLVIKDLKQQVAPKPKFVPLDKVERTRRMNQGRLELQGTAQAMTVARLLGEHMGLQHRLRDVRAPPTRAGKFCFLGAASPHLRLATKVAQKGLLSLCVCQQSSQPVSKAVAFLPPSLPPPQPHTSCRLNSSASAACVCISAYPQLLQVEGDREEDNAPSSEGSGRGEGGGAGARRRRSGTTVAEERKEEQGGGDGR